MASEAERRALMRRIWNLNISSEEGRYRLQGNSEPWLIENFFESSLPHLVGSDLRISFLERRTIDEVPLWERVQRFRQSIPHLYRAASVAREKAMSYRDFRVGVAVLAFKNRQEHGQSWRAFSGMNTKYAQNMRPTCAEPIAINAAYAEGFARIVGMVVVGELREEDIGHILTLHPCHDCRWFMHGHPLIDRRTLVFTALPEAHRFIGMGTGYAEIRSVGQLLSLHQKISGDDFQ